MAQIKSAEKRNRQKDRRRARNRLVLGNVRAAVKKARAAVETKDKTVDGSSEFTLNATQENPQLAAQPDQQVAATPRRAGAHK